MILKNESRHGWNQTLAVSEKVVNISKSYNVDLIKKSLIEVVPEYCPTTVNNNNFDFVKKKNKKI